MKEIYTVVMDFTKVSDFNSADVTYHRNRFEYGIVPIL